MNPPKVITLADLEETEEYKNELTVVRGLGRQNFQNQAWGYKLQQIPEEFAALLCFLRGRWKGSASVRQYVEIGSASGGFIRAIHERVGFYSACVIDRREEQYRDDQDMNMATFREKVNLFPIDSHSQEAEYLVRTFKASLYVIDGDHEEEGVWMDSSMILSSQPFSGALIMFHDIHCKAHPGVAKVYAETLQSGMVREVAHFHLVGAEPQELGIGLVEVL